MRKSLALILAIVITMISLTACGSSGLKYASDSAAWNGAYEMATEGVDYDFGWEAEIAEDMMWDEAVTEPYDPTGSSADIPADSARKIIKNGSLEIETLDFDKFIFELEASIASHGGYVESSSQNGGSTYYSPRRRANYTVRIPAARYDSFVNVVGELGTVTSSNEYIDDVTLQYVDIEARLKALTAERDSFMALMDKAETIEDILKIQGYLTDVNYKIESYTSQLNTLKNLVSYSTVNIQIYEVERVTPAEPKTVWERISQNFSENLYDISVDFTDFFVAFVSSIPYLIIYAIFIGIIVVIAVSVIKANKRKQQRRTEEYGKAAYGQQSFPAPQNPQNNNEDQNNK